MDNQFFKFNARILIADDYLLNQEITKEMLEMMQCKVDVAENGKEALSLVDSYDYDLIFMDIQMPEMDGCEATQLIRKKEEGKRHTPIVALTSNALQGDREKYLSMGMDDYISKPVKLKELESILVKYLKS